MCCGVPWTAYTARQSGFRSRLTGRDLHRQFLVEAQSAMSRYPTFTLFLGMVLGLALAAFLGVTSPLVTPAAAQSSCPWHCTAWKRDACNTCSCENGKVGLCTLIYCLLPQVQPRCIEPPTAAAHGPEDCQWFGTAPFCDGECPVGWFEAMRNVSGDGNACRRGTKAYCCKVLRGQPASACLRYAERAIAQRHQALARGCPIAGPEWDPNFDNHFNWCRQLSSLDLAYRGDEYREAYIANGCRG